MTLNNKASKWGMGVPVLMHILVRNWGHAKKKKKHEANIETREMLKLWNNLTY
jgi:hypothetical protein